MTRRHGERHLADYSYCKMDDSNIQKCISQSCESVVVEGCRFDEESNLQSMS
jgi:hypothetical protein